MKLILIFLISWCSFGCVTTMKQYQEVPSVELNVLDFDDASFYPYKVTGEDQKECKLKLKPMPKIPFVDPKNNGMVCFKAEDWQKWRKLRRTQCEAHKK